MTNQTGWIQLLAPETTKAETFYGQLFNWSMNQKPTQDGKPYVIIDAGKGQCGGIVQIDKNVTPQWVSYINVDNINTYTEKAKSLGAEIIVPITEVGNDQGYYSVFKDPSGAVLGLWGPK